MRCVNCGYDNKPGSRFCENCGAGMPREEYVPVSDYQKVEKSSGGIIKSVLIGLGIGLAVLAIIFGVMHFLNNDDDDGLSGDMTATEATSATTTGEMYTGSPTQERSTQTSPDSNGSGGGDYSAYTTEAQLYQSGAPEILPNSSSGYLSPGDLSGLNEDQIQKAINDIYARNGKIFDTPRFSDYYYSQSWYSPVSKDQDTIRARMNDYEIQNIETMSKYIR